MSTLEKCLYIYENIMAKVCSEVINCLKDYQTAKAIISVRNCTFRNNNLIMFKCSAMCGYFDYVSIPKSTGLDL